MKTLASIDIGTNTVRLLILQANESGDFREIDSVRRITRLGEGIHKEKRLLPHRMENTIRVLEEFTDLCRQKGSIPLRAVATSAVREAANKEEFLEKVKERTGIDVEVISWEEEARLTLKGVFWKIPRGKDVVLTFDIGGGSTEYILSQGDKILGYAGTGLGTVRLTERYLSRHPVLKDEYNRLAGHVRDRLMRVKSDFPDIQPQRLIGTAGTVTTLAALQKKLYPYDPEKIHGTTLSLEQIQKIQRELEGMSLEERRRLKPLEQGREDLIIAGTAIVVETMCVFGCPLLTVSEYGLREGILLNMLS